MSDTYQNMKTKHRNELDEFQGIFWAFNKKQFSEGMKKVGLDETDTKKIMSLGCGGYILKTKSNAFGELFDRQSEERERIVEDRETLLSALTYELQNHEYCITYDPTPALSALGLTFADVDKEILKEAQSRAA